MRKIGFISNLRNNLGKWLLWCPEKPEPKGFDWEKVSVKLLIARAMEGKSLRLPLLALILGLGLLIVSAIPMTTVQEAIDISFTVDPGVVYGPHTIEYHYLYRNLSKTIDNRLWIETVSLAHYHVDPPWITESVARGEVLVEGESIHLEIQGGTSGGMGYSRRYLVEKPLHIAEKLTPGEPYKLLLPRGSYIFIFNSNEATSEASVRIRLEEIWTRPIALGSGPHLLGGFSGILMSLAGSLQLVIRRLS